MPWSAFLTCAIICCKIKTSKYVQQILCSYHAQFVTGLYRKIQSHKTWFSNIYENMNFKTSENPNKNVLKTKNEKNE
jgi:hypothetical protein